MVRIHPGTAAGTLTEIHASGVGWTDELLDAFMGLVENHLTGLSFGFSPMLTSQVGSILSRTGQTLTSLAMHFCGFMTIDLSIQLGKVLPNLRVFDIHGAGSINSITSTLDARATVNGYKVSEDGDDQFPFIDTRAVHSYDFQ